MMTITTRLRWCVVLLATVGLSSAAGAQTGTVMPYAPIQFLDNSGDPCASCQLYAFAAGTTTPLDTYSDVTLMTAHAHPIVLDANGRATVFLSSASYKFQLDTAADVTLWTQDNVDAVQFVSGSTFATNGDLSFQVDADNNGTNIFTFLDGAGTEVFQIAESGNVQFDGNLTLGAAAATDVDLTFDGNAQDFYIGLDDSLDDLVIGVGAVVGSNVGIQMDQGARVGFGTTPLGNSLTLFGGSMTSSGIGTSADGVRINPVLTATTGDTAFLAHLSAGGIGSGAITTQGAMETIGVVATAYFKEPAITVGSGDTVTTAATVYIVDAPTEGSTNNDALRVAAGTSWFGGVTTFSAGLASTWINDTANTDITTGFTINQGAADDGIFALKSSDIAHGVTTRMETDSYAMFTKNTGVSGGLRIDAIEESASSGSALTIFAVADEEVTFNPGAVEIQVAQLNGTGVQAAGDSQAMFTVGNNGTDTFDLFGNGQLFLRAMSSLANSPALYVVATDRGSGTVAEAVQLGRNSNGSGSAGVLIFEELAGTEQFVWVDDAGALEIATAGPQPDGTPSDTSGTVVGTQTSYRASKDILGVFTDHDAALRYILDTPLYTWRYREGYYQDTGRTFVGPVSEESPGLMMLATPEHPTGRAFNPVTAWGLSAASIKALYDRLERQAQQIERLDEAVRVLAQE
jgi:hypothetical protein